MTLPFSPAPPDLDTVRLRVMDANLDLARWTSYSFKQHLLKASDGWSLAIGGENADKLSAREVDALQVGARVRLYVSDAPLAEGFIDNVQIGARRGSGSTIAVHGRNRLGLAVDAVADPTLQFKDGASLLDVLQAVYAPFGWVAEDHFLLDNEVNRDAKKGIRGTPMTKGGKKKGPRPLKSFVEHQLKPHNHEGLHAFASRIAERHGLRIWCTADGEKLVVSRPDFFQEPTHRIIRSRGYTNVLDGNVTFDATDQPSIIIADGFSGGGGEFGRGRLKTYCINPYFGVDHEGFVLPEVKALIDRYPDAKQVICTTQPFRRRALGAPMRPVFLHDEESKTQEQLDNFVRREMSLAMRKSLTAEYTVQGHGQLDDDGAVVPFQMDEVVEVFDEIAGVAERMYVLGVGFDRSRRGTETSLELIRLHTIELGDPAEEAEQAKLKKVSLAKNPDPIAYILNSQLSVYNFGLRRVAAALGGKNTTINPIIDAARKTTRALK